METRYAAGYREPEPCAARFRRARRIDAVETLEDPLRVFGRYADAMVFDDERRPVRRNGDGNGYVGRPRMAYRVFHEIQERLRKKPRVDLRDARRIGRGERQGDPSGFGARAQRFHRLSGEVDKVGLGKVENFPFALKPCKVENLLNEYIEPRRLL